MMFPQIADFLCGEFYGESLHTVFSLLYRMQTDWLESRFRAIGLDTYIHNYSFVYPMSIVRDQVAKICEVLLKYYQCRAFLRLTCVKKWLYIKNLNVSLNENVQIGFGSKCINFV